MIRVLRRTAVAALLISVFCWPGLAFEPYAGYNYDSWNKSVPAPNGYEVAEIVDGRTIGCGELSSPADFVYRNGTLYILDSGNARIVMTDGNFKMKGELSQFTYNGEQLTLSDPQGIFVTAGGDLFIADTGNKRVLQCEPDGKVVRIFIRPTHPAYTSEIDFLPIKVLADSTGDVYVIVRGMYFGAVRYNAQGVFNDFYGANYVQPTAAQLVEKVWKKIMTATQRKYISNYVPVYFRNFDIDSEDFIYTVTAGSGTFDEIKKINNIGINILKVSTEGQTIDKSDYGDKERVYYAGKTEDSWFEDIDVSEQNLINALDTTRNRVFQYDQDSNLLFVFGGTGSQKGLFDKAVAVESIDRDVLVLDMGKANITVFKTNLFADAVHQAVDLYMRGFYDQAVKPWETVLQYNANYDTAYIGIGKALAQQQKYEESLKYFGLGNDRASYSQSYKVVRSEKIQKYFALFAPLLIIILLLILFKSKIRDFVYLRIRGRVYQQSVQSPFYVMKHPIEGFEGIRRTNSKRVFFYSVLIISFWFITSSFQYEYTGFIYNLNRPGSMNVWLIIARTYGVAILFTISNWAVSIFMDGEGKLKRIWIVSAYSLLPYTICSAISTVLSNVATLDEQAIVNWVGMFGMIWSAFLLYGAIKEVHQFNGKRTVLCIAFSVVGMLFCIFILVLSLTLTRQLYMFILTVTNEILLRTI